MVIVQANLRWEDAANARRAIYPIALASVEQVDPVSRVLPAGINGAFLGFAENLYQLMNIYIMVPLWFPVDGNVLGSCAQDTPGNWPTCNPAHRLNTITLHDGATEYMYLATEVPGDYVSGSEVRLDAEFYPGDNEGDYYFFVQTFFTPIGSLLTIAPPDYSEEVVTTVSCNTGIRQQATFGNLDMTGASAGDKMFIRVGRRGADALDTATGDASMTGMRLWFKRQVQVESAVSTLSQ